MTTISVQQTHAHTTPFERTLLRTAAALDLFVAARLERRNGAPHRRPVDGQNDFAAQRRIAEAHGALGLLPR